VTYTRRRIDTINPPFVEHNGCLKHVENLNKYTRKRIVNQIGYLQELYRDERSAKHKVLLFGLLHPEDQGNITLRNIINYLPKDMTSTTNKN
jgi:hypothetical protein